MTKQVIANSFDEKRPHFVLVPLMAQGHIIPMVDLAHLIAHRGALVSFITTPVNAARIQPVIDRAKDARLPIRFIQLKFPSAEVGLPDGCENLDLVTGLEQFGSFFSAVDLLREPFETYLREVMPVPSCIITDYTTLFTAEVAQKLSIPRIIFHGSSCLFILAVHNNRVHKSYEGVDEFVPVVVPDLPHRIETSRAQTPGWFPGPDYNEAREKAIKAEASADGVIVNTLYELEPEIIEHYKKVIGKPVWPVGPLSLCNRDVTSKATRGNKSSVNEHQVLIWLNSKEPKSVIYVSFGSFSHTNTSQLIEIGCGLEASNLPFIWVIKETDKLHEIEKWMSKGFEERTKERSLVIKGWAPQVMIITHPSIGGFMTHCGWNSTLEAVSAGVPMLTWPHFADQFLNEKLVVDILDIAIPVGGSNKVPYYYIKDDEALVKREEVRKGVLSLMGTSEECKKRRERAAKFAEKAHKGMDKGGQSYENLNLLIGYIKEKLG